MYLINKSPTTALDGKNLEEVWHGKLVDYAHLCIFGYDILPACLKKRGPGLTLSQENVFFLVMII